MCFCRELVSLLHACGSLSTGLFSAILHTILSYHSSGYRFQLYLRSYEDIFIANVLLPRCVVQNI